MTDLQKAIAGLKLSIDEIERLTGERDELRAENEALKAKLNGGVRVRVTKDNGCLTVWVYDLCNQLNSTLILDDGVEI